MFCNIPTKHVAKYMVIIKLKPESKTVNRKPHRKVTKLKSTFYLFLHGLAQSGTEQPGQGATLLGWPKSIYYAVYKLLTSDLWSPQRSELHQLRFNAHPKPE